MTRPVRLLRWRPVPLLPLLGMLACGSGAAEPASAPSRIVPASTPAGRSAAGRATRVALAPRALLTGPGAPTDTGSQEPRPDRAGPAGVSTAAGLAPGTPAALYAAASSTCAGMPVRSTRVTHHFCDCATGAQAGCVAGDDASAGRTAAAPRRSWARAIITFNSMNAGDTVAFCKGGAWSISTDASLHNPRCAAAADMKAAGNTTTCDLRDYAPPWGGTAKPIIRQTANDYVFMFQSGTQRGVRILNLDVRGGGGAPGGTEHALQRGVVFQGENTDFLICNNTFDGLYHAIHLMPDYTPGPARIVIRGNRFTNNSPEGILGAANDSVIDANFFDNNGAHNVMSHSVYLNGQNLRNFSFVNNEVRRSGGRACQGVILVVHDQFDGLNIENNVIDGGAGVSPGCWGIGVDPGGYPRAGWYRNLTIRRNRVENVGWAAISVASAPSPIIENNIIVSGMTGSGLGIHVPGVAARTNPPDDVTTAARVRNNTIYFPATATGSTGIVVGDIPEGTNHVVANNAVAFAGTGGSCLSLGLPVTSYAYVDRNLCSGFQRWEARRGTRAAWQAYGRGRFDAASLTSAPQFENAPTGFRPAAGSPLIGSADAAQAPAHDFTLAPRPNPPSIGALER